MMLFSKFTTTDLRKQLLIQTKVLYFEFETWIAKCKYIDSRLPCSPSGTSSTTGGSRNFDGSPPFATLSLNSLRLVWLEDVKINVKHKV